MATCLDVITDALKITGVLSSGETPTADESTDGMTALQSFYDSLVHGGMFGTLEDVYLDENDVAEEGKRYFVPTGVTLTAATSIYDDNGTDRQPRDLALYESLTEAGTRSVKLYDRTQWVELTGLALTDDAPLAGRGQLGLAAALAISGGFIASFRVDPGPVVLNLGQRFMGQISAKSGSTQDDAGSDYF